MDLQSNLVMATKEEKKILSFLVVLDQINKEKSAFVERKTVLMLV
jgi:hypothetical protein